MDLKLGETYTMTGNVRSYETVITPGYLIYNNTPYAFRVDVLEKPKWYRMLFLYLIGFKWVDRI